MKIIAYYRRSKKEQESNLGLEAQMSTVASYVEKNSCELIAEYTELEGGTAKKRHKRHQIAAAIAHAQSEGAVLLIARLDRLARDLEFTSMLYNAGIKFIACDSPDANETTVKIMMLFAEDEAKKISQRTKDALAELKKNGVALGCKAHRVPGCKISRDAITKSVETRKAKALSNENNRKGRSYARSLMEQGKTLEEICHIMNSAGFKSPSGNTIYPMTVIRWCR